MVFRSELPPDLDAWPNREEFLEFNEILTQLCAPNPTRRYANAADVAGAAAMAAAVVVTKRSNGGIPRPFWDGRGCSVFAAEEGRKSQPP